MFSRKVPIYIFVPECFSKNYTFFIDGLFFLTHAERDKVSEKARCDLEKGKIMKIWSSVVQRSRTTILTRRF